MEIWGEGEPCLDPCFCRNSYLQKVICYDINPRIINRAIDKRMGWETTFHNLEPPFLDLKSYIPCVNSPYVFAKRVKMAFGDWGLPRLKRQLEHPDLLVLMQVLNTIHDEVHDPENGFTAIRIGIADRLIEMLLHEKDFVREKVCMIFYTLAAQAPGRIFIMRRYQILTYLARLFEDPEEAVRVKSQMVIEMLSRYFVAADCLNDADYTVLLIRLIGGAPNNVEDPTVLLHLLTLQMLLDRDVKILALEHNCMDVMMGKIKDANEDIVATALACLTLLCWEHLGKAMADKKGILVNISKKLYDDRLKIHTKAAGAVTFTTHTIPGKNLGISLNLLDRLLDMSEDTTCKEKQLMSMKALTNLSEHPSGRKYLVKKKIQSRIEDIDTRDDNDLIKHSMILLEVIRWKP